MDFEQSIINDLINKNVSSSSINLYMNNLRKLNNNNKIENFNFLKKSEEIIKKLEKYKPTTQRTFFIAITSILKHHENLKNLYDEYYKIMMKLNNELKNNTTKSEVQTENWITEDEIKKILDENKVDYNKKKKLNNDEWDKLLHYFILCLYTLQEPRRNLDYQMNFIKTEYNNELPKKTNYTILNNLCFVFGNYKTQKTYNNQIIPISNKLLPIFKQYIKFHPLINEIDKIDVPLLCNYKGEPFLKINDITLILNKMFKKNIGSSMLRNINLTNKFKPLVQQLNKITNEMGTSANTAMHNYIKLD